MIAVLENHPRLETAVVVVFSKGYEEYTFYAKTLEEASLQAVRYIRNLPQKDIEIVDKRKRYGI